ncbi:hypothetical protein BH09DEP1_BH09DEP1_4950 [soil metagenome]
MIKKIVIILLFCSYLQGMEKPSASTKKYKREKEHATLLSLMEAMIVEGNINDLLPDGDFKGKTILTAAAAHRAHTDILERALNANADANKADGKNNIPLKIAVYGYHRRAFKLLVLHKADPKNRGLVQELCSPWHDTLDKKKAEKRIKMLNALLETGCSANELDGHENTVLYHLLWAWVPVRRNKFLFKDISDDKKEVFYHQRKEMIRSLLKAKLNAAHVNRNGHNAIDNIGEHPHLKDPVLFAFLQAQIQKTYAVKP